MSDIFPINHVYCRAFVTPQIKMSFLTTSFLVFTGHVLLVPWACNNSILHTSCFHSCAHAQTTSIGIPWFSILLKAAIGFSIIYSSFLIIFFFDTPRTSKHTFNHIYNYFMFFSSLENLASHSTANLTTEHHSKKKKKSIANLTTELSKEWCSNQSCTQLSSKSPLSFICALLLILR